MMFLGYQMRVSLFVEGGVAVDWIAGTTSAVCLSRLHGACLTFKQRQGSDIRPFEQP